MQVLVVLAVLAGCGGDKGGGDDTAPAEEALSPYEMPDRSGCSYDVVFDVAADGTDDWWSHYEFDEADRAYLSTSDYPSEGRSSAMLLSFDDNDCVTSYDYGREDTVEEDYYRYQYTGSCDEHGWHTLRDGSITTGSNSYAYAIAYENHYDGSDLTQQDATSSVDGEVSASWTDTLTWSGGLQTSWTRTQYGDDTFRYTWDYGDDELLDEEVLENYQTGSVTTTSNTYDERGRTVTETVVSDAEGALSGRSTREWHADIFQVARSQWDLADDGTDDAEWTFVCEGAWPWSCDVSMDGAEDGAEDAPHDGVIDHSYTLTWSCP